MSASSHPSSNWPKAVVIVVALALASWLIYYFGGNLFGMGRRLTNWPGKVARGIGKVLQAKVTVENGSFTLQRQDIAELAVVQRRIVCTTKYEAKWLGSEAIVIVKGIYTIKAGFDLSDNMKLTYDENGLSVNVKLPEPRVLSVTTEKQEIFYAAEGILKGLKPKDMETAYSQNLEQAKREAADLGLLDEARSRIRQRLEDTFGDEVKTLEGIGSPLL